MTIDQKIEVCKKTRLYASETLVASLRKLRSVDDPISETLLCECWLDELRKSSALFDDGWYSPPPHGLGVLFGTTKRESRHNYKTLRDKEMWSDDKSFLDTKNGTAYLFASPVNRTHGIIGDFGVTIYFGKEAKVIEHFKLCQHLVREIFEFIQIGMKFSELYEFAEKTITSYGLTNEVTSKTDPTGKDYGHTIPGILFNWNNNEESLLKNADTDWDSFKDMINKKRVFVNRIESTKYKAGMALTLEPRLVARESPDLPMVSFHTIVVIEEDGTKNLITNFDEIFSIVGMNYMLA